MDERCNKDKTGEGEDGINFIIWWKMLNGEVYNKGPCKTAAVCYMGL